MPLSDFEAREPRRIPTTPIVALTEIFQTYADTTVLPLRDSLYFR